VADDVRGPDLPYMELVIGGGAWPLNPVVLDYVVLLDSPMGVLDVSSTPVHQIVGFEFRIEDAFAFFDPEFVNPELQEIWPDGIFLGDVYVTYAEDSAASAPPAAAALLAGLAALGLFRRRRR
jgi:MYXO-CTERM domain-containing protein